MTNRSGSVTGIFGADPDQLSALGGTLLHQRDIVETMMATVHATLDGTTWTGPARAAFESEWQGGFRVALQRLATAFSTSGRECQARADELRRVMGVG
jgi:uncharacterized protein YukE